MVADNAKWFRVSLRVMGDGFDPMSLAEQLGLTPDVVGIKGQRRVGKNGREYAPYETNIWCHEVKVSSDTSFDGQIRLLFQQLGNRVDQLRALSATNGVEAEVFCGFSSGSGQGGDIIQPGTLKLLADTGLSLSLDLYPPDVLGAKET